MTERAGLAGKLVGAALLGLTAIAGASDLGLSLQSWDDYAPVGIDEPLPQFDVALADGGRLRSADLEGEVTVLTFWATWCGACGLEMPVLRTLDARLGDRVQFYGINRDSGSKNERVVKIHDYAKAKGISFPHALDSGRVAAAFGVEGIPHTVVVDRRGRIRHVHVGRVSERRLGRELEALLAE